MADRPLSGIRVLDFGHYLAGPLVGMMLADLGAEVIRVDPPNGQRDASPLSEMLSRGKRSLVIDLQTAEGVAEALAVAARCDVVIENFRPGVMSRLGLGRDVLSAANPQLIQLSLPGFASTDGERSDIAAWEAVIAATTGQFTDMGLNRRLLRINPSFTPLALASAYASTFGAMAVLFALAARDVTGGDHIEVPLASSLIEGLAYNLMQIEDYPERYKSPREVELERRADVGDESALSFDELSEFLDPFYRTYSCADGRGFYVVAGSVAGHQHRVLEVLGLAELAKGLPDFDPYLDSEQWPANWSLRNYPVGEEARDHIAVAMAEAFLTRPSWEWEEIFGEAKAPATAQRWTKEWLSDPHALASGLIVEVEGTPHGTMKQMGNVAWIADDEGAAAKLPGPRPDDARADIEDLMAEPARQSVGLAAASGRGWLDGLKVLDLSNVIAGPTIGSTLARFGAEVTLVQPTKPTVDPWNTVVFGLHAQQGKQSALINLRTSEGQRLLSKLISRSDVITFNGTDQQRAGLGLTDERLAELNPEAVLVQLDAFGGPRRGPKSDHLGYDDLAQAATGVMLRFGGAMDTPEEHAHFGTIDALTGFCACVGLGAALVRRSRTGQGGVARTSLAAAGNLIQAQFMFDHAERAAFDEPSGREVLGWGPFYRCYQTADETIFFAAPTEQRNALLAVPELSDVAEQPESEIEAGLTERFATKPARFWTDAFAGTSSAAVVIGSLHSTREESRQNSPDEDIDLRIDTFRTIRYLDHPMGRWCDLVAPNAIRPQNARIVIPTPTAKYGKDTRSVVSELGVDGASIESLFDDGVIADSWSEQYLPE